MVNDQIEIKEVVNPAMFKKFRNRLLQRVSWIPGQDRNDKKRHFAEL
jgi:hypothetical protein